MPYLPVFFWAAGGFIGLIYTTYAWGERRANNKDLKNDPRIKGLIWCLSGLMLIFIADWKRLLTNFPEISAGDVRVAEFISFYLTGFILGAVITLFLLLLRVIWDTHKIDRLHGELFSSAGVSPVAQFALWGYDAYQKTVSETLLVHREKSRDKEWAETSQLERFRAEKEEIIVSARLVEAALERRKKLMSEANTMFVSTFDSYRGCIARNKSSADSCKIILSSIATIASYYTKLDTSAVNCNYMVLQSRAELTEDEVEGAKFTFGDSSRYQEFLLVAGYAKSGTNVIRLPIEPFDKGDMWAKRTLPGAPSAFVHRKPVLCLKTNLHFGSEIPPDIRAKQQAYLTDQKFDAIASFPIRRTADPTHAKSPIGILNIDLTFEPLRLPLLAVIEDVDDLALTISPFITLLGDVMTSARLRKGDRNAV